MFKNKREIRKEYMNLKLEAFSHWYNALTDIEKEIFNTILSDMRDEFHDKKSDNNAKEETI